MIKKLIWVMMFIMMIGLVSAYPDQVCYPLSSGTVCINASIHTITTSLQELYTNASNGNTAYSWGDWHANASAQQIQINDLEGNVSLLWSNASTQNLQINALQNAGYFNDISNFTGTLINNKFCTYNGVSGQIDCNTDANNYNDSLLWTNASDQNIQINALQNSMLNVYTKSESIARFVNRSLWSTIDNYPSGCPVGQYVTAIGDTLTCATVDTYNDSAVVNQLQSNVSALWTNASDQNIQINALQNAGYVTASIVDGYFNNISNFTGTLTNTKYCTYNGVSGEIDCNSEGGATYNDTALWTNASNQQLQINAKAPIHNPNFTGTVMLPNVTFAANPTEFGIYVNDTVILIGNISGLI